MQNFLTFLGLRIVPKQGAILPDSQLKDLDYCLSVKKMMEEPPGTYDATETHDRSAMRERLIQKLALCLTKFTVPLKEWPECAKNVQLPTEQPNSSTVETTQSLTKIGFSAPRNIWDSFDLLAFHHSTLYED